MPGYPRKWIEQYKAKHPEEFPEISRAAAALEEAIIPN